MTDSAIQKNLEMLTNAERVFNSPDGIEFISFCLEAIKVGKSVQTIWSDWQNLISSTEYKTY